MSDRSLRTVIAFGLALCAAGCPSTDYTAGNGAGTSGSPSSGSARSSTNASTSGTAASSSSTGTSQSQSTGSASSSSSASSGSGTSGGSTTSGASSGSSTGTTTGDDLCAVARCADPYPICLHGQCYACSQDSDCSTGACDLATNSCLGCNSAHGCASGLVCNPGGVCLSDCRNVACPNNPSTGVAESCDSSTGICAVCNGLADCPSGLLCSSHQCVTCASDGDCVQGNNGNVCGQGICYQCHAGSASDAACGGGACAGEGVCCSSMPGLCP